MSTKGTHSPVVNFFGPVSVEKNKWTRDMKKIPSSKNENRLKREILVLVKKFNRHRTGVLIT